MAPADVSDPAVVAYVKKFQTLIDHYMIGTFPSIGRSNRAPGTASLHHA